MKPLSLALALLLCPFTAGCQIGGNASVGGNSSLLPVSPAAPIISGVSNTSTATTIEASFSTSATALVSLTCIGVASGDSHTSVDAGVGNGLTHQQIVAGVHSSSAYNCTLSATNAAGTGHASFTITTTSVPASTPITGLTIGSSTTYNSLSSSNQGSGDTFYNCKSNDGFTYMTSDDNSGFTVSGLPSGINSPMSMMRLQSESPFVIQTINGMTGYGPAGPGPDGLSSKNTGLFCMNGYIFEAIGRQDQTTQNSNYSGSSGAMPQTCGAVIWSPDHGKSWNNFQALGVFNPHGAYTNPICDGMFGSAPTTFATAEFVHYCADDGTLGYTLPCNRHDSADAFIYLIGNEGTWSGGGTRGGGNAFYLARVARAHLQDLDPTKYQWYTGSGGDGSQDAAWNSAQTAAQPIITNTGELGEPNVQFFPALNRYLLLTFYYPQGTNGTSKNITNSVWLGYESPHPWGPWTLVYTSTGGLNGAYNPVILNDSAFTGTTPTLFWTGNFAGDYQMYFATMTITH